MFMNAHEPSLLSLHIFPVYLKAQMYCNKLLEHICQLWCAAVTQVQSLSQKPNLTQGIFAESALKVSV